MANQSSVCDPHSRPCGRKRGPPDELLLGNADRGQAAWPAHDCMRSLPPLRRLHDLTTAGVVWRLNWRLRLPRGEGLPRRHPRCTAVAHDRRQCGGGRPRGLRAVPTARAGRLRASLGPSLPSPSACSSPGTSSGTGWRGAAAACEEAEARGAPRTGGRKGSARCCQGGSTRAVEYNTYMEAARSMASRQKEVRGPARLAAHGTQPGGRRTRETQTRRGPTHSSTPRCRRCPHARRRS